MTRSANAERLKLPGKRQVSTMTLPRTPRNRYALPLGGSGINSGTMRVTAIHCKCSRLRPPAEASKLKSPEDQGSACASSASPWLRPRIRHVSDRVIPKLHIFREINAGCCKALSVITTRCTRPSTSTAPAIETICATAPATKTATTPAAPPDVPTSIIPSRTTGRNALRISCSEPRASCMHRMSTCDIRRRASATLRRCSAGLWWSNARDGPTAPREEPRGQPRHTGVA